MQTDAVWLHQMRPCGRMLPRSSSPVSVSVALPLISEQEFSTIAWEDLEGRPEISSQLDECDLDNNFLGDYSLDFLTDSAATLESSLSAEDLVPFQGCIIPPLTPEMDFCQEDAPLHSSTHLQNGEPWRSVAEWHGRALERSVTVNKQLRETLCSRQEELTSLQEKNLPLRQLADRAKHLASVLEKRMTIEDLRAGTSRDNSSPEKRQRLDEGYETESSDSVEDLLRDMSTRCNAVLLNVPTEARREEEPAAIRMHGAFSGLCTSTVSDSSVSEATFRTSVGEHGTIRTQVFPGGHAFTSRTLQGGHRFRWVPHLN